MGELVGTNSWALIVASNIVVRVVSACDPELSTGGLGMVLDQAYERTSDVESVPLVQESSACTCLDHWPFADAWGHVRHRSS